MLFSLILRTSAPFLLEGHSWVEGIQVCANKGTTLFNLDTSKIFFRKVYLFFNNILNSSEQLAQYMDNFFLQIYFLWNL